MGFFDNHGMNYRRIQNEASFNKEDLHGIQAAHERKRRFRKRGPKRKSNATLSWV